MIGLLLVGAVLAADDNEDRYLCDVSIGAGNHYGTVGVGAGCGITPMLGLHLGSGVDGIAGEVRIFPQPEQFPSVFLAVGYAPVAYFSLLGESYTVEGPTLQVGAVRRRGRLSASGGAGIGYADLGLLGSTTEIVVDLAVGVNFGTRKSDKE